MSKEGESKSREFEDLRVEAERRLYLNNECRARELKKILGDEVEESIILSYLNQVNPDLLEIGKYDEMGYVLGSVSSDEKIFPIPQEDEQRKAHADLYERIIHPRDGATLGSGLVEKIGYDPAFWKNEIAKLRSVALLYRHLQGQDPVEIVVERLVFHTAEYLRLQGQNIPPWLLLRMPQSYRDEVGQEMDEIDRIIDKFGLDTEEGIEKLIKKHHGPKWREKIDEKVAKEKAEERAKGIESTGMHPKMYDRREEVAFEQRMATLEGRPDTEEVFKRIFDAYPDTRVLVDRILVLKDGKLPV